jgi:hypothetical protein
MYLPPSHEVHSIEAAPGLYFPFSQIVHEVALAEEYLPEGQFSQVEDVAEYLPAAHVEQPEAPADETLPAAHQRQLAIPEW